MLATFKDENMPMQQLARELDVLRKHNKSFKEGDPQDTLLLHAEAGLVFTAMEHFVRVVLGDQVVGDATLHNLLEMAVSRRLIELPFVHQWCGITQICERRNSLLHGNFAQAARLAKKGSVAEYFKTVFAPELEQMFEIADNIIRQIDPNNGKPFKPVAPRPEETKPCGYPECRSL